MKKLLVISFTVILAVSSINFVYGVKMKEQKVITLPKPDTKGKMSLETAILDRRSVRSFADKSLTIKQIGQLLWAAQGITKKGGYYRAAPSPGALYPLEIYVAKKDGLFHYMPKGHKLIRLSDKDLRGSLESTAYGQSCVGKAAIDIIVCATYKRVTSKYHSRGIRYTDIEVGHVGQNIQLQAVALGLASVPVGAFSDEKAAKALSLPKDETPLYIIPVGYKK